MTEDDSGSLEQRTRRVFHSIHKEQLENSGQLERTLQQSSLDHLGLEPGFFAGKECLEAGCGTFAPGSQNMLAAGAKSVTAMDLNATIHEFVPGLLAEYEGRYTLTVGDVLDLPFPDASFDFVLCDGVLHHTRDPLQGAAELARVTRPGGTLFLTSFGKPGLMHKMAEVIRDQYAHDPETGALIDELDASDFRGGLEWLASVMSSQGDPLAEQVSVESAAQLFDPDLVLTIKDRIQAPVYQGISFSELEQVLAKAGCGALERVKRYQSYANIRQVLAPLYFHPEAKLARLLYGDGYLRVKARKL